MKTKETCYFTDHHSVRLAQLQVKLHSCLASTTIFFIGVLRIGLFVLGLKSPEPSPRILAVGPIHNFYGKPCTWYLGPILYIISHWTNSKSHPRSRVANMKTLDWRASHVISSQNQSLLLNLMLWAAFGHWLTPYHSRFNREDWNGSMHRQYGIPHLENLGYREVFWH